MSLVIDNKTEHISYLTRKGISYASAKELALALGGNYYYSDETSKLELKFSDYNFKGNRQKSISCFNQQAR
ncbi:MAG: hypothetical protein U5K00_06560 [Melioribacteraceae bacterium]|nr:hypothetical protein [Melioribacteraceae bacterium]